MTFPRRLRPLSVAVLGAALLGGGAGVAQADPIFPGPAPSRPARVPAPVTFRSCSVSVPSRVVVAAPRTAVPVTLSGDCPVGAWAAWDVLDPAGRAVRRVTFPASAGQSFTVASSFGKYTLRPVTAHDTGDHELVQNRPSVTVGARSRTVTASTRAGATVRVTAVASSYSATSGGYAPRAGARVVLQRSTCASGCAWVAAASGVTARGGAAALTATSARPAVWRVVVAGTPTVWGSVSAAFRR